MSYHHHENRRVWIRPSNELELLQVTVTNVGSRGRLDLDLLCSLLLTILLKSRQIISAQLNTWDVAISEEHSFFKKEENSKEQETSHSKFNPEEEVVGVATRQHVASGNSRESTSGQCN
jgi:hypothetical protein